VVTRIEEIASSVGINVELESIEVAPPGKPPLGYKGSPTILMSGMDLETSAREKPDSGHG